MQVRNTCIFVGACILGILSDKQEIFVHTCNPLSPVPFVSSGLQRNQGGHDLSAMFLTHSRASCPQGTPQGLQYRQTQTRVLCFL